MKAIEVHKLSNDEIDVEVKRLRSRQFELRVQSVTEKIEDTSQFRKVRHDLARLLTERGSRGRREVENSKAQGRTEGQ